MIYVDQRGSGQSDEASDYRLDRVVDDLDDVRRALGYDKVYLLSHSFGGLLALHYLEKYPAHVLGWIAANSTVDFPRAIRGQPAPARRQRPEPVTSVDDGTIKGMWADRDLVVHRVWKLPKYTKIFAEDPQTMATMTRVDGDPPRVRAYGRYVDNDPW